MEEYYCESFSPPAPQFEAKEALNVNIPHEGANLVSARPTDNPISSWHKVSPCVYINTHSSTSAKKTQLEKLFKALHLN